MFNSRFAALLILLINAAACAAPPEVVELPTLAVLPSPLPTLAAQAATSVDGRPTLPPTWTPTFTPSPTLTSTPTPTITPSETPTPTTTITLTPTESGNAIVNEQGVNLRSEPNRFAARIAMLDVNTPLVIIGKSDDSAWYEVRTLDGQTGWMFAQYVTASIDTASLPVTFTQPTAPAVVSSGALSNAASAGSFELGGHVLELNGNTVNLARRARMTWVKMQYRYTLGEGVGNVAGMINAAHSNGFRILVSVVGQPAQMGSLDSYIAAYSAFVADAASAGADGIEVWNEPNIDREWTAGQISGANYTRLLAAAYNAIKARSPGVLVMNGAPAPTGFFGGQCTAQGCDDNIFMAQMAAAGAGQYMDCVAIHYNEGIVAPSVTSGDPRGEYQTYYFQGMLNRASAAFSGKPICFTELGYLSPEGYGALPGGFAWAQNTSVSQHAAWLGDAVRSARGSGRVRLLIVWNVDFPFYGTDPAAGYAILRPGGGCPACDTLSAAMG